MALQAKTVGKAKGQLRRGVSQTPRRQDDPPKLSEAGIDKNLAKRARAAGGDRPLRALCRPPVGSNRPPESKSDSLERFCRSGVTSPTIRRLNRFHERKNELERDELRRSRKGIPLGRQI
jgi:hypothetical protein